MWKAFCVEEALVLTFKNRHIFTVTILLFKENEWRSREKSVSDKPGKSGVMDWSLVKKELDTWRQGLCLWRKSSDVKVGWKAKRMTKKALGYLKASEGRLQGVPGRESQVFPTRASLVGMGHAVPQGPKLKRAQSMVSRSPVAIQKCPQIF